MTVRALPGPARCAVTDHVPTRITPSPSAWGVAEEYHDAAGGLHRPSDTTLTAVLDAMGAEGEGPPTTTPLATVRPGGPTGVDGPTELITEDGATVGLVAGAPLPPDVPLGYHTLVDLESGVSRMLVVSPGACLLPEAPTWGWAVQLYAARSRRSWGIGDLADLGDLAHWSATELGAGLMLVNPLHAATPGLPQAPSPYYPSSRRFRNPLFLRIDDVPGAPDLGPEGEELAAAGRRLNADRRIDRDAVFQLKMAALTDIWLQLGSGRDFERWNDGQGPDLEAYATFCVLAEEHGRSWRNWPADLRHPEAAGVAVFRARHRNRIDFHRWVQWLLDVQLERASADLAIVHDLAVGFDPDGADAWEWQDVVAPGMSVGAPPDEFNTRGQDWGLPPFDPWRLRAVSYRPFVETVRSAFRHAGGLRVDHVMGLFRLFWVPQGAGPAEGTYVRYPGADLLDIVALESHRAGAWVVGEDLGTVEDEARAELAAHDVLSYRLFWFEQGDPVDYPAKAMAAVTTHDLPTVAGLWSGADLAAQYEAGMEPNAVATAALRARVGQVAGAGDDASVDEVVAGVYEALARAPSLLLAAGLDDALGIEERPNMPGTIDQWPNWSIALPATIEEVMADPRPRAIAALLDRDGAGDG